MAQIDLKHSTIVIADGTANTVNVSAVGTGGGAVGATSIPITAVGAVVADGNAFHIAGDVTLYTVVGNTSSTATTLRFQPGLQKAVTAAAVITFDSGGKELEVKIGEGTLTYTEKRNIEYRKNRGLLDTVREGEQETVEVSFDFIWEYLRSTSTEPVTVEEALKQTGRASSWLTTSPDPCEPYCVDIIIHYHSPCSSINDEIITLQYFRWDSLDHNLKDGTVSVKGQCNVTQALVARQAQLSAPGPEDMMAPEPTREESVEHTANAA